MPDGQSLVFTSEREGTGAIYRVHLADGRVERLSQTRDRAIMPAVSPDGRRIAYAVATARGFQIFVLDLASGEERQMTRVDEGACRPAWSRDGSRIAYVRMKGNEPSWLEVLDVATGDVVPLVDARPMWSYYPAYSSDGRQVAFAVSPEHHAGEDWDIALVDPSAPDGFRRVTRGRGNDRVPVWRP
jgi:Tol biopolymer transport system component